VIKSITSSKPNFQTGVLPGRKTAPTATATKLSSPALGSRPQPGPEWVLPLLLPALLQTLVMLAPLLLLLGRLLTAWLQPGLLMLASWLPPALLLKPVPPPVLSSGLFLSFCFSPLLSHAIPLILSYLISSILFAFDLFTSLLITSSLDPGPFFILAHLKILSTWSSSRTAFKKYLSLSSSSISRRPAATSSPAISCESGSWS